MGYELEVQRLRDQIQVLREALISVVIGNDIAAVHNAGKLTSWPGSVPAEEARKALAATEPRQ
jgi:hypothetical protein